MIKTYITINSLNLTTSVNVGEGNFATLNFTGGRRYTEGGYVMGKFSTSNEALQKAIETDSGYGVSFVLDAGCDKQEMQAQEDSPVNYDLCDMIPGIKNRQDAMLWLQTNKGIELPPNSNVAAIKSAAQDVNVVFSDWQ